MRLTDGRTFVTDGSFIIDAAPLTDEFALGELTDAPVNLVLVSNG